MVYAHRGSGDHTFLLAKTCQKLSVRIAVLLSSPALCPDPILCCGRLSDLLRSQISFRLGSLPPFLPQSRPHVRHPNPLVCQYHTSAGSPFASRPLFPLLFLENH